jgi:hypothetical protein
LFAVTTLVGAWLAVSGAVNPAAAIPVSGTLNMSGSDTYDLATNNLNIVADTTNVLASTGDFAGLSGSAITFNQCVGGCQYATVPGDVGLLTGLLFTGVAGSGLTFTIVGVNSFSEAADGDLDINANGIVTLAGRDATPAVFSLTTQLGGSGTELVSFSASTRAVPGPVVGAGLPGLLAACGGLLAFARRRRQKVI